MAKGKRKVVSYVNSIDVFRHKCFLLCDLTANLATVYLCGFSVELNLANAIDFLNTLAFDKVQHSTKEKRRDGARLLVFVNELDVLKALIKSRCGEVEPIGNKERFGFLHINYLMTDRLLFANFNVLSNANADRVHAMIGKETKLESCVALLDEMSPDWTRIRWSLAHKAQADFYRPIAEKIWKETRDHKSLDLKWWYLNIDIYKAMLAGSAAGLLARFDGKLRERARQVKKDVVSFDKSSAYPSVFVSDDKFPLGLISEVREKKAEEIVRCVKSGHWFKIFIDTPDPVEDLLMFRSPDLSGYGIDYYDYLILRRQGKLPVLFQILNSHYEQFHLYTSDYTGFLTDTFRLAILKAFSGKAAIKDRSDPRRYYIKTQIDMLFGKGLQRLEATTTKELNKILRGRGDKYLRPEHSMHAVSRVRYELFNIVTDIFELGGEVIAFDTDGFKAIDGDVVRQVIDEANENERIRLAFALDQSGATSAEDPPDPEDDSESDLDLTAESLLNYGNCGIGQWDLEYRADLFIQIGTKQYVWIDHDTGQLESKTAGISKLDFWRAVEKIGKTGEELFDHLAANRIYFERKRGYIFDPVDEAFDEVRETVEF